MGRLGRKEELEFLEATAPMLMLFGSDVVQAADELWAK